MSYKVFDGSSLVADQEQHDLPGPADLGDPHNPGDLTLLLLQSGILPEELSKCKAQLPMKVSDLYTSLTHWTASTYWRHTVSTCTLPVAR